MLLWIVRNEHLNLSHRVFSQRCFHLKFRNPYETGAPLHLHSRCRENDQLVCMLLRFVWPFWDSETSKGRIVHLRSERRRNCMVLWAVTTSTHLQPDTMFALGIYLWETIVFFRYVSRCFDVRVLFFLLKHAIFCRYITLAGFFRYIAGFFTFAENFVPYLKKKNTKPLYEEIIGSLAC